jgi:hypothetical protein
MNLHADDLILFTYVMEAGSFAKAAERVGLPKFGGNAGAGADQDAGGGPCRSRVPKRQRPCRDGAPRSLATASACPQERALKSRPIGFRPVTHRARPLRFGKTLKELPWQA